MSDIASGDLVTQRGGHLQMLVIGSADEDPFAVATAVFCVWERDHLLHEEVFRVDALEVVRKERRRVIRGGNLDFPSIE